MLIANGINHLVAKAMKDAKGSGKELRNLVWQSPDFEALMASASSGSGKKRSVAVLPLSGLLEHTQSLYGYFMGGTDLRQWGAAFESLVANDSVKALVLDVNTPGGTAFGTPETAAKVYAARGTKPIVAVVNPMMDSAGYYIGSAADAVFITQSGEAGSIGTVQIHEDWSKALEADGISVEVIKSGANKYEGHPYGPLSEETRQHFQADVDELNSMFTAAVAKHRGVSVATVKSQFGDGRVFTAPAAVERGMADKIATIDQVVRRLNAGSLNFANLRQEDWDLPVMMDSPKRMSLEDAERILAIRNRR
jgi:signal peptide peptidase SppA